MGVFGNYFIDGSTLENATAVFTDATLTTPAPDGFYSNSVISREQVGGVLLAVVICPSCVLPCNTSINAGGGGGIYTVNFGTGSSVGAIILYFNVSAIPDGIRVQYNNQFYNETTSATQGYLSSNTNGHYTFVGNINSDCNIAQTLNGGGYSGENTFNFNGANFDPTGSNGVVTGNGGDVRLTIPSPGPVTLYIPKPLQAPEVVSVEIFGPCANTGWTLGINCPVQLTGFSTSKLVTGGTDCLTANLPNTYFNVPNSGGLAGDPAVNEFCVVDPNGSVKASQGTYYIQVGAIRKTMVVDGDGIINSLTNC